MAIVSLGSLNLGGPRRNPFRQSPGARNMLMTQARYAAGFGGIDGMGDMGSLFGKIGKGISKGASKFGSALSKAPSLAAKTGSFIGKTALLPARTTFGLTSGLTKGVFKTAGGILGTVVTSPLKALVAGGRSFGSEASSGWGGGGSPSGGAGGEATGGDSGGGASSSLSPSGGGGGGGGGDDTETKAQGLGVEPPPGMSLPVKIAIGAAGAAGLYLLWKKFGPNSRHAVFRRARRRNGGRSVAGSKSR